MKHLADRTLLPGTVLAGTYVLRGRLGAGGMGTVYLADQPARGRRVAIKVLHPSLAKRPALVQRFREEASIASRVRHRGSVPILDAGATPNGAPFIVMGLVPGRPLGGVIAGRPFPVRRAVLAFRGILESLDAVHACSVVHGDVKSDNFLIDARPHPGGDALTLIDFGLAHVTGATIEPGLIAGTPEYMAPELACGEPTTVASDLYGAGAILYELLTGTTPFGGGSAGEILRRQVGDVVIPPSLRRRDDAVPAALDRIALRALAKARQDRFDSAEELRLELARIPLAVLPDDPEVRARASSWAPSSPTAVEPPPAYALATDERATLRWARGA